MYALLISVIMLVGLCLASSNQEEKSSVVTADLDIVEEVAGASFNRLVDAIRMAELTVH